MRGITRRPWGGIEIVRIAAAAMMIIHGTYRIFDGGVTGFGGFLASQGLPAGVAVAWLLTIVEIVGGILLASGRFVRPLCAWFSLELLAGIALVHFREGWFVVGGGRNGFEYSVLLIVSFVAVAVDAAPTRSSEAAVQTT
jgi:putative oxidoreductase